MAYPDYWMRESSLFSSLALDFPGFLFGRYGMVNLLPEESNLIVMGFASLAIHAAGTVCRLLTAYVTISDVRFELVSPTTARIQNVRYVCRV